MHERRIAALGVATLTLALTAPARADHPPCAEQVHSRHHHHHRHGHRHGHGWGHHARHVAYHCDPCGHRYADYGAFQTHLTHRHHIPIWRIPQVIVEATFGWIFYG